MVSLFVRSGNVSGLADRNSEKYERWLKLISELADKGEFRNVSAGLSHLTAAGTVLEDPQIVYISEFLEWVAENLRPALFGKKTRPEHAESAQIMKEAFTAAIVAVREPSDSRKMHETFTTLRYRATRLQLSRLAEAAEPPLSPTQMLLRAGDWEQG